MLIQLEKNDFRVSEDKCQFNCSEVVFLGHRITSDGIQPSPKKVQGLRDAAEPTTKKEARSFLGLVNYYRDFIENLSELIEPIQHLTKKDAPFLWTEECKISFNTVKALIAKNLRVYIFDPAAPTTVTTDASDVGLGAVLSQVQSGRDVPIAFASRSLSPTERNYAANEREALGCVWACEHWDKYLLGRHFTPKTDHQALTTILMRHGEGRKAAKFSRYYDRLKIFDYTPKYTSGEQNKVADALSRLIERAKEHGVYDEDKQAETLKLSSIHSQEVLAATQNDAVLQQVQSYLKSHWPNKNKLTSEIRPFYQVHAELSVVRGLLIRNQQRVIVPISQQRLLLGQAHEGHPGIVRMKRNMRDCYWWPGMDGEIEAYVKHCLPCQRSAKSNAALQMPAISIERPKAPGDHYSIDIAGPFYNSLNLVCLIDNFSSYPEVLSTKDTRSTRIIDWIDNVFSHFSYPRELTSDNGPQFVSEEFEAYLERNDIRHNKSAVYTPQGNGRVEVFNRHLKYGVQAFTAEKTPWEKGLRQLLSHFRATPSSPTADSPAKLFLGRDMRLGYQLAKPKEEKSSSLTKDKPEENPAQVTTTAANLKCRGPYRVHETVLTKLPQCLKGLSPYSQPKRIVEVLGNYTYRLSDGKVWNARKMRRYLPPAPTLLTTPGALLHDDDEQLPRRSNRRNIGRRPQRYSP